MKTELRPCPFCGSEAELKQTGKMQMTVRCKSCHMGLVQKVLRYSLEWLEETLIELWNTRKGSPVEGEKQFGEWVSTKDRLPEFDTWVLCFCRIYGTYIGSFQRIDGTDWGLWNDGKQLGSLPPTHWCVLPNPPKP